MGNNYLTVYTVKSNCIYEKIITRIFQSGLILYDVKQPSYDCLANRYPNFAQSLYFTQSALILKRLSYILSPGKITLTKCDNKYSFIMF